MFTYDTLAIMSLVVTDAEHRLYAYIALLFIYSLVETLMGALKATNEKYNRVYLHDKAQTRRHEIAGELHVLRGRYVSGSTFDHVLSNRECIEAALVLKAELKGIAKSEHAFYVS